MIVHLVAGKPDGDGSIVVTGLMSMCCHVYLIGLPAGDQGTLDLAAVTCPEPIKCNWWAFCPNLATAAEAHPILGDVPICASCAAKLRTMDAGR